MLDKKNEDQNNDEENYKKLLADDLNLSKTTPEQQYKEIKRKRKFFTTIVYRHIKNKLDFFQIIGIAIVFTIFGYCLYPIFNCLSIEEIKVGIRNFFEVLCTVIMGVILIIWKIYTPPSEFTRKLIEDGHKNGSTLDKKMRTVFYDDKL